MPQAKSWGARVYTGELHVRSQERVARSGVAGDVASNGLEGLRKASGSSPRTRAYQTLDLRPEARGGGL